jgi:predicted NAD/FAD-dependent oxidoreductase
VLDQGLPETLERRPDVLVVGGEILGVSASVAVRAAGAGSVLLIEAGRLGVGGDGTACEADAPGVTDESAQRSDPRDNSTFRHAIACLKVLL